MTAKMNGPSQPGWVFEKRYRNGGAVGRAAIDLLSGQGLSSEERLVREAIQNSVDATVDSKRTEVNVFSDTVSGSDLAQFIDVLRLESPSSPVGRLEKLGLADDNAFLRIKNHGAKASVHRTTIADFNTVGLTLQNGIDRFKAMCMETGMDSLDADASGRGGSYGYGKAVYWSASNCNTFIIYSRFLPSPELGGIHARLFGCSTFNGHDVDGTKYQGRAWFGIPTPDGDDIADCVPIKDEQAHDLAFKLGFLERSAGKEEEGTSVMIVGSEIDTGLFKSAVED